VYYPGKDETRKVIRRTLQIFFWWFWSMKKSFESIDEYISSFPKNVQSILEQIRRAVKDTAPKAEEAISYNMPAFKLNGNLVWFGAFKNHIGFYPRESAIEEFKEKLTGYEVSKVQGTVKFPLDKPMPLDLIKEMVKFRVKENLKETSASKYS